MVGTSLWRGMWVSSKYISGLSCHQNHSQISLAQTPSSVGPAYLVYGRHSHLPCSGSHVKSYQAAWLQCPGGISSLTLAPGALFSVTGQLCHLKHFDPKQGIKLQKNSHLPWCKLCLQLPTLLLQSFDLFIFCQEGTGLFRQVLGPLASKCFFTQLKARALHSHWSIYLRQGENSNTCGVIINHHRGR